jgi:hypothetical protein
MMLEAAKKKHQHVGIGIVAMVVLLGLASATWGLQKDYDGTYYGTFSGDDSGVWVAKVGSAGETVFLSYSTSSDQGDGGYMTFEHEYEGVGLYYVRSSVIQGSWVEAYINSSDGRVSGLWGNSSSGRSGELSGGAYTSCSYAGTYSGSFSGDDSGSWSMTIASNGHITGAMSPASGGTYSFEGGCHPDGYIIVVGEVGSATDFAVFGRISGGTVSGKWMNVDGDGGSTVGSGTGGGGGDSDGGGGGGGCFIMSLAGE